MQGLDKILHYTTASGKPKTKFMLDGHSHTVAPHQVFYTLNVYYGIKSIEALTNIGQDMKKDYYSLAKNIQYVPIPDSLRKFPLYAEIAHSMQNSGWRAVRRCKLFQDAFDFQTLSRFRVIEGRQPRCDEEYAREFNNDTYQIISSEYAGPDGRVMLTDNIRNIIRRRTAAEVAKLGWEFDYEEYTDVLIDERLIDALVEVFPEINEFAYKCVQTFYSPAAGDNPFIGSEMEKQMNQDTVHVFEEAIGYNENDIARELDTSNAFEDFVPSAEDIAAGKAEAFFKCVQAYVVETERLQGNIVEPQDVEDIANALIEWYERVKARC